jgi:hypothetical protein
MGQLPAEHRDAMSKKAPPVADVTVTVKRLTGQDSSSSLDSGGAGQRVSQLWAKAYCADS